MRKVVVAIILVCIMMITLGSAVPALSPPGPTPPPPPTIFDDETWGYYSEDTYMHWAPAVYYGQPVWIQYVGPAHSFFIAENNYFYYSTRGTAKVYEAIPDGEQMVPGDLIDERPFMATIRYKDPRNSWGWPPLVFPALGAFGYIDSFYMNWVIAGVYDYTATCKKGHWSVTLVAHTAPPVKGGEHPDTPPYKAYFPPNP